MNNDQQAAFILSQTAMLNAEVAMMVAANQYRTNCGDQIAYGEEEFANVIKGFETVIGYNAVIALFRGIT